MNKPLFSIITICYNSEKTIERTIKSVLSQTFTDFEYIIVDGASKDNTLEIANRYKAAFGDKLRVSSEPDKGIYDAMNKGIKLSAGNIIGIVNSDDWLEPNALQIVYEAYVKNGRSNKCLYTGGINFHGSNGTKKQLMPDIERLKEKAKMYQMAGIRHPATFVPKEIYNEVGLFDADMHILADTDFILRCYYKKYDFFPINKILSNMADGGISNQLNWKVARKSFRDKRKMLFNFEITSIYRIFLLLHSLAIIVGKRILPKRLNTHTQVVTDNSKFVAFVEVLIPITKCNIKCHYCYVIQRENRTNHHALLPDASTIAEALSAKRFGGYAYISLCGAGETMLTPNIENIVYALLQEGHYVNITTNGTITKSIERFEALAKEYPELSKRLNFSFSLHHLELERTKLYPKFWDNVERVKRMKASYVIQINLCDEYEPYLDKIKEDCIKHVGAYPQVAATRDEKDMASDVRLFTKHTQEEYEAIGNNFNSPLFEFTMRNFMVKRKEFCYAGKVSYVLNLSTGIIKPCYCSFNYQNIYRDISKPIKLYPVGQYCQSPFCMNSSHFISLGTIPELKDAPTYASLRNRICIDGSEWYTPEFKNMSSQKLCDNVDLKLTLNDRLHVWYYGQKSYFVKVVSAILPKNVVKSIKGKIKG